MLTDREAIRRFSAAPGQGYMVWGEGDANAYTARTEFATRLRGTFSPHRQGENLILFPLARRLVSTDEIRPWLQDEGW